MLSTNHDQDEFDAQPPDWHDHLTKAFLHHTGHGPHPGAYSPLAELRHEAEGAPDESEEQKQQPTPPQEALPTQPPLSGSKGGDSKPPSKGTPVAIGESVVEPPPPAGDY